MGRHMAMADNGFARAVTFRVSAARCPQLLCRLMGLFAQQDRLVHHANAIATPRRLRVTITICGLDDCRAEVIAEKMRQLISVHSVSWRAAPV